MNNFDLVNAMVTSNIRCIFPNVQQTIERTTEDEKTAELCFVGLDGDGYSFSMNMSYKEDETGSFVVKLKVLQRSIRVYIEKAYGSIPCSSVWSKSVAVQVDIDTIENIDNHVKNLLEQVTNIAKEAKDKLNSLDFNIHADAYIIPENYKYVGSFRLMPNSLYKYLTHKNVDSFVRGSNENVLNVLIPLLKEHGVEKDNDNRMVHCMSCNHKIMGGGVAKHIPTNTYIYFGCTCSETRFSFTDTMEKDMANLEKQLHRMFYLAKRNGMYESRN